MTTATPYTYSGGYTYQMNVVLNGCSSYPPNGCQGVYWLQGVASVGGGEVTYWTNEVFWEFGTTYYSQFYCDYAPTQFVNINQVGYSVIQQTTIHATLSTTYEVTIVDNNGHNVYQSVQNCPSNPSGDTIYSMNLLEGAIVGTGSYGHASFTPLNTNLFTGYIDLVSDVNSLGSANLTTQTGETSNLYQIVTARYGESYNGMFLYTVQSNENTESST